MTLPQWLTTPLPPSTPPHRPTRCGPCKIILPTLVEMNAADPDVEIVKFNCNQENKVLGKELGIRVAPTFHLYKGGEKLAEMTGAKPDKLKELIDQYK